MTRKRQAFLEPLEDRSLLASLLQTQLPDVTGPQAQAAFGHAVAAGDTYYAVGAPSVTTTQIDTGEVYVYNSSGALVSRLTNPNPGLDDRFGSAVAVSGNLVVVGAWKDDVSTTDAGGAYLFRADTGALLFSLTNPNPNGTDEFGYAVAIEGNLVAVSARGENAGSNDVGIVYIYSATTGMTVRTITNPDAAADDRFGSSLAMRGTTLIVGTPGDDTTGVDSGRAYLFNPSTGSLIRTLENPSPADGDQFGTAVAIAGSHAVVGAPFDDGLATDAGAVHQFDGLTGNFVRTIDHPAAAAGDQFGVSVGVNGDQLVVGAAKADDPTNGADAGRAFLFSAATGSLLSTIQNPTPNAGDEFGGSVAVSNLGYVVGSATDDTGAFDAGLAYYYTSTTGGVANPLANASLPAQDAFGSAVAIAGDWYIIGSPGDDRPTPNSGKVRIHSVSTGALVREYLAPPNAGGAAFGTSLAVSGNILAVGAPGLAVGGVNAGAVLLFDLSTGLYLRTIENPLPAVGDQFGWSIAFDGNRLVIGSPLDDTQAADNGAAYEFDATTGALLQTLANPSAAVGDQFGFAVATAGDYAVVGSPNNDQDVFNGGRVHVFNALDGALTRTLSPSTGVSGATFGYALDLEGTNLAIGAPSTSIGSTNGGRAYLFNVATGVQAASLSDPTATSFEYFGSSVALSGNKLLIGTPGEAAGGAQRGAAQLFDVSTRAFVQTIPNPGPQNDDQFGAAVAVDGNRLGVGAIGDPTVNHREGAAYLYKQSSLSATISGSVLTISDLGISANLTAVRDGNDLVITDATDAFETTIAGAILENGGRTVRIPFALFDELRFALGAGNDTVTLDVSGGDLIPSLGLTVDNGLGLQDAVTIAGAMPGTVTYSYLNSTSGSIVLDTLGTVSFAGTESLRHTGELASVVFNLPAAASTATLLSGGSTNLQLTALTIPTTFFDNPSDTLAINRGNAADSLSLNALTSHGSIVLGTAAAPIPAITFASTISFNPDRNLTAFAANTISLAPSIGDLSFQGTGSASLTTSRDIVLGAGASITTQSGNIQLTAAGGATGAFTGVRLFNGAVVDSLNGNVTVSGRGGVTSSTSINVGVYVEGAGAKIGSTNGVVNVTGFGGGSPGTASSTNVGVYVAIGGLISGGSAGTSTVTGTGGINLTSSSFGNDGVIVTGANSRITTGGGSLVVTGTGGGNVGVRVDSGGQISAGGAGDVTVNGTGGNLAANTKVGVSVSSPTSRIFSNGGNVRVEGRGGSNSSSGNNHGVHISVSGQITAGGSGTVTVIGTGDFQKLSTGSPNHGVFLDSGLISSAGGAVAVTGTGNSGNNSSGHSGVHAIGNSLISAGGSGSVIVEGTGATPSSNSAANSGVYMSFSNITASGGSITVRGTAGVATTSVQSIGVYLAGAQLTAAADVLLEGWGAMNSGAGFDTNVGVTVVGGRVQGSGNITLRGFGGGFGFNSDFNYGVDVAGGAQVNSLGAGTLTIEGTGGGGTGARNFGIRITDGSTVVSAVTGAISLTGAGRSDTTAAFNHGIVVTGGANVTTAGDVTLVGTGGAGSGSCGIEISSSATRVNSTGGLLRMTGTAPPSSINFGIATLSGGIIGNTNSLANIELIADAMSLQSPVQTANTRTVTLLPKTPGLNIVFGLSDAPNSSLGFNQSELEFITTGTIQIGNANTGNMTLSGPIQKTTAGNLSLTPGLNKNFSLGLHTIQVPTSSSITIGLSGTGSLTANTTGTSRLTAGTVAITAQQGNIGASNLAIWFNASTITATTLGSFYLANGGSGTATIGPAGLSAAGAGGLAGGNFALGGADRISDTTAVELTGTTNFALNGFNESFYSLAGSSTTAVRNGSVTAANLTILAPTGTNNLLSMLGGATANDRAFNLFKQGGSTLVLGGNSNFVGDVVVFEGVLVVSHANALGGTTGGTIVGPGSTLGTSLDLNGIALGAERITLLGPAAGSNPKLFNSNTSVAASASGDITLSDGTATIGGAGSITLSGKITDSTAEYGFTKVGAGMLTLTGTTNDFNDDLIVSSGELRVNGAIVSPVIVESGATVSGTGSILNAMEVRSGANVAPGAGGAGTLTAIASYLQSGAQVNLQFASAASTDIFAVAQSRLILGAAGAYPILNLSSLSGFVPTSSGVYTLLRTDLNGIDPPLGQLVAGAGSSQTAGTVLTEGMLVTDSFLGSGFPATISYVGGSGNDVVLNVGATTVKLMSGNVVITDTTPSGQADNLTIVRNGADLVISDSVNPLVASPGFTQVSAQSVSIPFANITGNLQINTAASLDRVTVDFSGGDPIPGGGIDYNGGAPTTALADNLIITGPNLGAVTIAQPTLASGTVTVGSFGSITFASVEAIRQLGTASDLTLTPVTSTITTPNALVLEDDGTIGNGMLRFTALTMAPIIFTNPTGTLTINRGSQFDAFAVGATATSLTDLTANLEVGSAAAPLSTVNFSFAKTQPADRSLSAFANDGINFLTANSDWATSGTGSISLTSARSITFANGSSLTVADGNLTLSANQQLVRSFGDFKGVEINGATISSSGTGQVTVLGRGGSNMASGAPGQQYGVYVYGGGVIRGGTTGLTRVVGTGGQTRGSENSGVKVGGTSGGTITSLGANVEVIGQAGGFPTEGINHRGVDVEAFSANPAIISAGGLGTVTVRGTGSTVGERSSGVRVAFQQASITSSGGRVEVVGVGGSSNAAYQIGVLIQGGTIAAGTGADLLLQGTGGTMGVEYASGIRMEPGSVVSGGTGFGAITVNGGNAQVIGLAGNASLASNGVSIASGVVSAGATGSLTITGTASTTGLYVGNTVGLGMTASLLSAGANVTLIGRAGHFQGMYLGLAPGWQFSGASVLRLEGYHGDDDESGGIYLEAIGGTPFVHTGTGAIEIVTDRLVGAFTSNQFILSTGSISIDTVTPGVPIILGFGSEDGLLLETHFLEKLRAATLNIGSTTSGPISIDADVNRYHQEQLNLTSGGEIEFLNGNRINTLAGGLKLSPGPAGVTFNESTFGGGVTVGQAAPNILTFANNTKFNFDVNFFGPTALRLTGAVDLTGTTLAIGGTQTPFSTQSLTVVENDGTDPIIGTFTGLPEGTIVNVNGVTRRLTYVGGTGNDVVLVINSPPTITAIPNQIVNEDSGPVTINLAGITAGGESQSLEVTSISQAPLIIPHPTVVYTSPNTTGTVTFAPLPDQTGNVFLQVRVRDAGFDGVLNTADDNFFTVPINVTITPINDAPSFVKGANVTLGLNAPPQSIAAWATAISPGPNESAQAVAFNVTNNTNPGLFAAEPAVAVDGTLTFTPATGAFGTATITLRIQDSGGVANGGVDTGATQTFTITINPTPSFQVTTFVPTSTGGILNFSRDFDQSQLNLYDLQGNVFGAADIVFRGSAGNVIKGSAIVDSNLRRITFVATNGRLPADDYTLTLRSAANGFRDLNGELLDGDADGAAGGDFVRLFTVAPDAVGTVAIRLPNFARGPLQPVNIPANGTSGLPISFSDGAGITSASFELRYNPAILTINGATVAPGLTDASVTIDTTTTPGVAVIQFTSTTPLPVGTSRFIDLQATVPNGSDYRAKQVLDLRNIVLNGGAIPAADDDAVHVNTYFGDTTGNGTYSGQDASNVARLATAASTGLQIYKLLDPVIIADITGNGGFAAGDTTRIQQASVVIAVPEIPPLPIPAASILIGGPDPKLSIPQDLAATAGGALTIPVHIDSIVDLTGSGLESGELVIYYDATVFDIEHVALGSLLKENPGWTFASRIDALAGRVFISFSGLLPLEGFFQGELMQLHATVKADAVPGPTAINLAASARDAAITTQLNEGWLTLIPAPTDAPNDPGVDGLVTISRSAADPQIDGPTAQVVGNQLRVTGTSGDDLIFVAPLGVDKVRVRTGSQILGTFPAPSSVLIDSLGGSDHIHAAPSAVPTLIAARQDTAHHDLIFAGTNSLVVDSPATTEPASEEPSAQHLSTRELALLQMLADWSTEHSMESPTSGSTRGLAVRRR